jgi:hypothetical protein
MLIPSYVLNIEIGILIIILIAVAHRQKRKVGGVIALSLIGPTLYFLYVYTASCFVSIEQARILARAGQALQWAVMIVMFGRLLRR